MLLADAAQAVGGKLYVLGGGWSVIGPGPATMAIAMKIDVPWDQTNLRHHWILDLVDEDGQPAAVPPVRTAPGEEERRAREAQLRRDNRLAERAQITAERGPAA